MDEQAEITISRAAPRLIGAAGYFALAVGAMVGSGWVMVLGDWLGAAGPGGAVLGFLLGGLAMMLIGLSYGELAARFTTFGGEFLYVLNTLGRLPAFLTGWFLTLYAVSVCAFEAVVLTSLLKVLIPAYVGPALYTIGTTTMHAGELAVGILGVLAIGILHARGVASAIRFQKVVTFGFLIMLAILIAAGLSLGSPVNWQPLLHGGAGHSTASGVLWVFSSCAFFLNGWQTALHAIEERRGDVSPRRAVLAMVSGILVGAGAYCGIILAASAAAPWKTLLTQDMPAVAAFAALIHGGSLGTAVVAVALVSVAKTWNAIAWVATRLIVAQGRVGFLPSSLSALDPLTGAPRNAILLITGLSLAGPALGRAAILPIVNMVAICLALSIMLCLIVLLRLRQRGGETPSFTVPGSTLTIVLALASAGLMVGVAVIDPLLRARGVVPPEWTLMAGWATVGLLVWWGYGRRAAPT